MIERIKNRLIDISFEIGILVKGIFAAFEVVGSFFVLFLTPDFLQWAVDIFTREELTDDPTDFISNFLQNAADSFSVKTQMFIFLYLLIHGVVKLFLVGALFKKKLWAYPASIVVFSAFIFYQIHRFTYTHSPWLIVFSIFDAAVVWFIYREFILAKERAAGEIPQSDVLPNI